MATNKTGIYVYADWIELSQPTLIGILSVQSMNRSYICNKFQLSLLQNKKARIEIPNLV